MAAANTRITFCTSTDKLHWETDLSQVKRSSHYIDAFDENKRENLTRNTQLAKHITTNQTQFCCDCGCTMDELDKQINLTDLEIANRTKHDIQNSIRTKDPPKIQQVVKEPTRFCCDCGCMIDEINQACESVERKFVPHRRSRSRLVRQYSAPSRCR